MPNVRPKKFTKAVHVYLTEEMYLQLGFESQKNMMKMGEYMRSLLVEKLWETEKQYDGECDCCNGYNVTECSGSYKIESKCKICDWFMSLFR